MLWLSEKRKILNINCGHEDFVVAKKFPGKFFKKNPKPETNFKNNNSHEAKKFHTRAMKILHSIIILRLSDLSSADFKIFMANTSRHILYFLNRSCFKPPWKEKPEKTNIPVTEDRRAGILKSIFASHLKQSKIFFPCHPYGFHIIQNNRHRYLIIPGNHNRSFCRLMMEDHMITALADECATGHLKYPNLYFPIRRRYLFQIASLKHVKIMK